jgi:hypothetical protein
MQIYGNPGSGREHRELQTEYIPPPPKVPAVGAKGKRRQPRKVRIDGINFGSCKEAAEYLGVSPILITRRLDKGTGLPGLDIQEIW